MKEENERIAIENAEVTEDERDRLLREWEERRKAQENEHKLLAAKSRQDLEKRIAQRRAKQAEKAKKIIAESSQPNAAETLKVKTAQSQKTEISENVVEEEKKAIPNFGELVLKSGILAELEALESTLERSMSNIAGAATTSRRRFLGHQRLLCKLTPLN